MPKLTKPMVLTIEGIKVGTCSLTFDPTDNEVDITNITPPRLRDALRFQCRVHVQLMNKRYIKRSKKGKNP